MKILKSLFASLLSYLAPGLGLLYCGHIRSAIYTFIFGIVAINAFFATIIFWDFEPLNIFLPAIGLVLFYIWVILYSFIKAWNADTLIISCKILRLHKWYYYLLSAIIFSVIHANFILYWTDVEAFSMPASSMENSLLVGDYFIADLNAYENSMPEINDIVIFLWPADGTTNYVKRCVATEGQKVEIIDKVLYVDDSLFQNTPYVKFTDSLNIRKRPNPDENCRDNWGPYVVPKDSYFMLGDNRDNSYDSRFWGSVHIDLIIAKPIRIHWSEDFNRIGLRIK